MYSYNTSLTKPFLQRCPGLDMHMMLPSNDDSTFQPADPRRLVGKPQCGCLTRFTFRCHVQYGT